MSVAQIETHGLKAILHSNVPLCYFLYSLLEELCSENLFFYLEVEQFENTEFDSPKVMKAIAQDLYDTFIKTDSEFEINIDQKARAPILAAIEAEDQKCFASAKEHIVKLMETVFLKFKNSPIYEKMKKELGNTCIYDKQAKNQAVKILLQNLDKTLPSETSDAPTGIAQERNDMIRAMLHAFCETRLGIDFIDRMTGKRDQQGEGNEDAESIRVIEVDNDKGIDSFAAYLSAM